MLCGNIQACWQKHWLLTNRMKLLLLVATYTAVCLIRAVRTFRSRTLQNQIDSPRSSSIMLVDQIEPQCNFVNNSGLSASVLKLCGACKQLPDSVNAKSSSSSKSLMTLLLTHGRRKLHTGRLPEEAVESTALQELCLQLCSFGDEG